MADLKVLFGFHAVSVRLKTAPQSVVEILHDPSRRDARMRQFVERAKEAGVRLVEADGLRIARLAGTHGHQGVAARVHEIARSRSLDDLLDGIAGPPLLLVLDGVTDPHNLGACLRTADAAGVQAVITPRDKSASITPVVRKVAVGAAETLPFFQVTNLARTMEALRERGIWLIGTALESGAKSLYEVDLKGALGIVMGAEGSGLRRLTREHCDVLAYIPMAGNVESLNVSVAAGVTLFEVLRQRCAAVC